MPSQVRFRRCGRHPVQTNDPDYTRRKVREFLATHTVYELIPESGKVVLLDCALPIRQAFHALHEQARRPTAARCHAESKAFAQDQRKCWTSTAWQLGLCAPLGLQAACWRRHCAVLEKQVVHSACCSPAP